MSQILMVLSPLLAANKRAEFEDAGFYLDKTFDKYTEPKDRWKMILRELVNNVVGWYETDIFSKKLAP